MVETSAGWGLYGKPVSSKTIGIVLFVILTLLCLPVGFIGACEYRAKTLKSGFDKVQKGDSRQTVIEIMGKPDETASCSWNVDCKDEYDYYSFMQRWMIYFDNEDEVIDKGY